MKTFLILLFLFGHISGDCDPDCSCKNLTEIYRGNPNTLIFERTVGCSQKFTCTSTEHLIGLIRELSNFPDLDEESEAYLFNVNTPIPERPIVTKDFFTEFGMICRNGTWFATKFPRGVNAGVGVYATELMNGRGYELAVNFLTCS